MSIFVFLGPTINLSQAKNILPDAFYLPPVQCGDLLKILPLKPKIIAIIDGYFEQVAAVWHKEILVCLEQGILVYGAASMGALRAAELAQFGMIGVGQIYQDYAQNILNDDDEVAIVHAPAPDYVLLTDAMVNVRATLALACQQKIITDLVRDELIKFIKNIFYRERSLFKAIEIISVNPEHFVELKNLKQWLLAANYVDQKKQDGMDLLNLLRKEPKNYPTKYSGMSCPLALRSERSSRLEGRNVHASRQRLALPQHERDNLTFANISKTIFLKKLQQSVDKFLLAEKSSGNSNFDLFCMLDWLRGYSESIAGRSFDAKGAPLDNKDDNCEYFYLLLKIKNEYQIYLTSPDEFMRSERGKIFKLLANLWAPVAKVIKKNNLIPESEILLRYTRKFLLKYKLLKLDVFKKWLSDNLIDELHFEKLMIFYTNFSLLVIEGNWDVLGLF